MQRPYFHRHRRLRKVLYFRKHSGFNLLVGKQGLPGAKADLEDPAQYILHNPFSVEKLLRQFAVRPLSHP